MSSVFTKNRTAVVITSNDTSGPFSARVWVNCVAGELGDATLVAGRFKTLTGAQRWASKKLEAAA